MRKGVTLTITRIFTGLDEADYDDQLEDFVSYLRTRGCDVVVEDEDDLDDDLTEVLYDGEDSYDEYGELQIELPFDVDE